MERINLAVVVAALVVLVMSAVKPEAKQGDYDLTAVEGLGIFMLNTDSGEVWRVSAVADSNLSLVPIKRGD